MWKNLFGEELLVNHEGEKINTEEALSNLDAVGIYFSAHWCPPCRGFTPVLAKKYQELKDAGKKFEIVFASSDQDETAFNDYFKEMPWKAMFYSKRDEKQELSTKYSCQGIPYLVILNGSDAEIITTNGRGGVSSNEFIENFPWHPKPMYDVSESMDGIEGNVSLIVIQNHASDEVQKNNSALLLNMAKEKKSDKVKLYFTANGGGPVTFIRQQCGLKNKLETCGCELNNEGNKEETKHYWGCDGCGKNGAKLNGRHRCDKCDFDMCDDCYGKIGEELEEGQKVPNMFILNVEKRIYYKALTGFQEVNADNLQKLVKDFESDMLSQIKMGESE